ncbi:hypothetical protein PoB_002749900 [Plakobranchus ocellatus]|uniref:Secreted protein n=1 Tax=Plakobranchus ocellatus TaxID=259542 RepID=A0AAV4A083_9GAST|nr:hypothetical protein PoB_002749900 [Plakobranchus ocellatus]
MACLGFCSSGFPVPFAGLCIVFSTSLWYTLIPRDSGVLCVAVFRPGKSALFQVLFLVLRGPLPFSTSKLEGGGGLVADHSPPDGCSFTQDLGFRHCEDTA